MILGKSAGIHNLDDVLRTLTRMRMSVVRISIPTTPLCTGFFILRNVIVAPAFVFDQNPRGLPVTVECFEEGEVIWSQQVRQPVEFVSAPDEGRRMWESRRRYPGALLALLRVGSPRPGVTRKNDGILELGFDTPAKGQFVAVVQFPRGGKQQGVSFGAIRSTAESALGYDADTEVGSSGAPVLDANWRVMGMHFASNRQKMLNEGLTRAGLIAALRHSQVWAEIKERHRIADVAAAQRQIAAAAVPAQAVVTVNPEFVRAALSSWIDSSSLDDDAKAAFEPYVADTSEEQWILLPEERKRIIDEVGSLEELRELAPEPTPDDDPLQQVIHRILEGPPYDLDEYDEPTLGWWIQASPWFKDTIPEIPGPEDVTRTLERRRVRSRLDVVSGADFRGRKTELEKLQKWWSESKKPLSLTGIGGIGKSALIARFASQLPESTLLLWLDFDRADLAPEDAPSVLSAIAKQAAVQLENFETPEIKIDHWEETAKELGERMHAALPADAAALLVLDSFEAAQYAERYQELWPVLELIAKSLPEMRLVVTGRAPVPELKLGNESAEPIRLDKLEDSDARDWLVERGVTDDKVLDRVLALVRGIPLNLRLAVKFLERGGKAEELQKELPAELVTGFLYDRILARVQNPLIRPLAKAALVMRRLAPPMVHPILHNLVKLPSGEVSTWWNELAREMALVEGTEVLRLRAEVRIPALKLLEMDDLTLVQSVDQACATWYADQKSSDAEILAELVYHRLRLGDEAGAALAWRDDLRKPLSDVGEDLHESGRAWLRARGVAGQQPAEPGAAEVRPEWDYDAAERIKIARSRGHDRVVKKILAEKTDRTHASPLAFQEAYELWTGNESARAEQVLADAGEAPGFIGRDRKVLQALLLAERGERIQADDMLASVDVPDAWGDRRIPQLNALALRAARVNLTVDLDAELAVLLTDREELQASGLSPMHVVLPRLRRALQEDAPLLEAAGVVIPVDIANVAALQNLAAQIPVAPAEGSERMDIAYLMTFAARRWSLITESPFLADASEVAARDDASPLTASIVGTLALFGQMFERNPYEAVMFVGPRGPIADVLLSSRVARQTLSMEKSQQDHALRVLREGVDLERDWAEDFYFEGTSTSPRMRYIGDLTSLPPEQRAIVIHLTSPDPLEQLVRELAGYSS